MAQTDLAIRFLSEKVLRELLPLLLPGHRVVVHELLRTEVKIVERKNDEVVRAEIDGAPTVLHVEFQSRHDAGLGLRLLAYHALLAGRYAPLPVRSLLVYLMHKPPTTSTAGFSDAQVVFTFDVFRPWASPIRLAQVAARPALAPLAALTPGIEADDLERLREAVEAAAFPPDQRGDLLAFTYVLAGRRFPSHLLQSFLRSKVMEDSPTYQIILGQGLERGRQEGRQGLMRAVMALVRRRLGEVPKAMETNLAALDLAALEALHEAVMDAPDVDAVRALLPLGG